MLTFRGRGVQLTDLMPQRKQFPACGIINIQWLYISSRTTINNETNINPIKRHCCLWLTFWILNNTHNAPLLSRGLPQVTFDLPGTCWIQIKCHFVLLQLNKLNPSTRCETVEWQNPRSLSNCRILTHPL